MLDTATFNGFPGGMNLRKAPQELDDTEAAYLMDVLIDRPGLARRRGGFTNCAMMGSAAKKILGLAVTHTPQGLTRTMAVYMDGTCDVTNITSGLVNNGRTSLGVQFPVYTGNPEDHLIDVKPALGGGVWIGTSQGHTIGAVQAIGLWRGAAKASASVPTVSINSSDKVTVTGLNSTNCEPGMFVFSGNRYIGCVVAVAAGTATLEAPVLAPAGSAVFTSFTASIMPVRGYVGLVTSGLITCSTNSATVTGVDTKFNRGWNSNFELYRASDRAYIGTFSTAPNDSTCTLSANAGVSMQNEPYIAINSSSGQAVQIAAVTWTPGYLNAVYAGKQFFAMKAQVPDKMGDYVNRVWYSMDDLAETVEFAQPDGNFFTVPSHKPGQASIRALAATEDALLILKDQETFVLTGDTPDTFTLKKALDDGCVNTNTLVPWHGGYVWMGHDGIWNFDGQNFTMLTGDTLNVADFRLWIANQASDTRFRAMLVKDHYVLYGGSADWPQQVVYPRATALDALGNSFAFGTYRTAGHAIAMYLPNKAWTMWSNMAIQHWLPMPAVSGATDNTETTIFTGVDQASGNSGVYDTKYVAAPEDITGTGLTDIAGTVPSGSTNRPFFFVTTKRFDLGDPMRKKLIRQLAMNYKAGALNSGVQASTGIGLDVYVGLNTGVGSTLPTVTTSFYPSVTQSSGYAAWQTKRVKFLKRDRFIGFNLYQLGTAANCNPVSLDSFAVGYKLQRPGRI